MNHFDIKCQRKTNEDGKQYYVVAFFIDDRPFLDMVRDFEASLAGDLAGSYGSLHFAYYTEDYLLGRQPEYGDQHDKTELLCCGDCGGPGCWPLAVRIRVEGQIVVWQDFEQPHRDWSYAGFGPFVYDLQEYTDAIGQIPKV